MQLYPFFLRISGQLEDKVKTTYHHHIYIPVTLICPTPSYTLYSDLCNKNFQRYQFVLDQYLILLFGYLVKYCIIE